MLTLRVGGWSWIGYVDSLRGLSIILHIILATPFSVFIAWLPNPSQIRVCQKLDLAFATVHKEAIQKLTSLGLHVYKLYILGIIIIKVAGSKAYSYIVDPISER